MKKPEASRFHYPCWSLEVGPADREVLYQVWAPGEVSHQGRGTGKVRDHWQAAWSAHKGSRGDVRRGESLEDVLAILPKTIADLFRETIRSEYEA